MTDGNLDDCTKTTILRRSIRTHPELAMAMGTYDCTEGSETPSTYDEIKRHLCVIDKRIDQGRSTTSHGDPHTPTFALSNGTDTNFHDHTEATTGNDGTLTVTHPSDGTHQPNRPKSDEIGEEARGAPPPSVPTECLHFDASNAFWHLPLDTDNQLPYHQHRNHIPGTLPVHNDGHHTVALLTDHRTKIYTGHPAQWLQHQNNEHVYRTPVTNIPALASLPQSRTPSTLLSMPN